MEIYYGTQQLASANPALGLVGPFGMSINGAQVVDQYAFFRAAVARFKGRGAQSTEFKFRVTVNYTTLRLVQLAMFTLQNTIPANADLQVVVGDGTDLASVVLAAAAYASVSIVENLGLSLVLEYVFKGGLFTTQTVPGVVPDTSIMKRGFIALSPGDEFKDVTFDVAFGSAPTTPSALIDCGGNAPIAVVAFSNLTTTGVRFIFAAAIPTTGYVLRYWCIL